MPKNQTTETNKGFQAAEELLKDKEYLFDAMMGAIGDLVSIQDLDMRIVYQNEGLKKLMGAHEGEFCYTIYEKRDKLCEGCPIQMAYKDGNVHKAIRVGVLPDGTRRRYENVAAVLKNKQGKIIAGIEIIRDVEERERSVEEIKKKTGELDAANQQLRASEQQLKAANQQLVAAQKQLQDKVSDMERFHKLTIGREEKMLELKEEIKKLKEKK